MECSEWPIQWPCDTADYDPDLVEAAQEAAQTYLWALTGRRYGWCTTTEQYRLACDNPCVAPYGDEFGPGVQYELGWGRRDCCRLHLAQRPVRSVDLVTVNGEVLVGEEYILERDSVMRIGQCWPCEEYCQIAPIEITYSYGIDVPVLGALAMGELACEFLRGWTGADCRLPQNAVSVTRQGVTVDLGDAQTLYDMGRIGLAICDAFIRSVNPTRLQSASQVWSPDLARRVR